MKTKGDQAKSQYTIHTIEVKTIMQCNQSKPKSQKSKSKSQKSKSKDMIKIFDLLRLTYLFEEKFEHIFEDF